MCWRIWWCALTLLLMATGCSGGSSEPAPGSGGTGGSGGGGSGASGAAGAACTAITGSYLVSATRDTSSPGSCPASLAYPVGNVASVGPKGAGYEVTIGAAGASDTGTCVASVFGCQLTGSCQMQHSWSEGGVGYQFPYSTELGWTLTDNGFSGTETWTNYGQGTPKCTASWVASGVRQ